ncbi:MAG: hypothetical protein IPN42_12885 [Methylococcaceae bacterium]|nr:hypothetical protein [Methylococcaceae bacterium]
MNLKYLQLLPESNLPEITQFRPFKTVVLIEKNVSDEWRSLVSNWIIKSGCLYMMAWGKECSAWDDSVDFANSEEFDFEGIPEDKFVMTTWHDDEPLNEVFFFCKNLAFHPIIELKNTVILHIFDQNKEKEILSLYAGTEKLIYPEDI